MRRQLMVFVTATIFAVGCGRSPLRVNGSAETQTGSTNSGLLDSTSQATATSSAQQQALQSATSAAQSVEKAWRTIGNGGWASYLTALHALGPISESLLAANLTVLAREFRRWSLLRPVYRLFNSSLQRHYYSWNPNEVSIVSSQHGFALERFLMHVYSNPFEGCTVPLYRCHDPVGNYWWLAKNDQCDGNINGRKLYGVAGYICSAASPDGATVVSQLSNGHEPLTSVSPSSEPPTSGLEYDYQITLGYAPH